MSDELLQPQSRDGEVQQLRDAEAMQRSGEAGGGVLCIRFNFQRRQRRERIESDAKWPS